MASWLYKLLLGLAITFAVFALISLLASLINFILWTSQNMEVTDSDRQVCKMLSVIFLGIFGGCGLICGILFPIACNGREYW